MKQFRHFLVLMTAFVIAAASCQQAPFLTMNGSKSFNFSKDGGSQSFTFSTNKDWSVKSSESWCKVSPASGSAGEGNVTVTVTVDKNTGYDPRTCTLTVKVEELTETVSVSQDMGLGLIVSPTTLNLTNAAQDFEIEVQKNVSYSVSMDDMAKSFITYNGTKGLTSEKASFSVAANDTYDDREGVIIFQQTGGDLVQTVIIKQSQTNGLFITTPEYDLSNEAHTLTVEVKANVEFEVTSHADWIKYVSASTKALKPSQITLEVEANGTYDDREGQVLVKQKGGDLEGIITIRQDENYGIFVSKEAVSIDKKEQTVEVEVKYNVDLEVIIPSDAQGKMISSIEYIDGNEGTKALATRLYRFGVTENTEYDPREVSITFKQRDGSLSGTFTISQAQKDGLIIGQKLYEIGRDGDTIEISLQTNVEYDVIIPEEAKGWINRVDSAPTKGLISESVFLEIAENSTYYNREALVVFKKKDADLSETVVIKQAQTDALFITDEVKEFNLSSKGGDVTINVFHNIPFEVDEASLPDWITTTSVDKDSYNATLTITVEKNTLYKERNANVTIKGGLLSEVVTINEHQVDIVYTDIDHYDALWKGGIFTIKIYRNVDYSIEKAEWIKEISKSTETEGALTLDIITFDASENLDDERTSDIILSWDNEGQDAFTKVSITQQCCTIVCQPGELLSEIGEERYKKVKTLVISGAINGSDILLIRRMSSLLKIDMLDSRIVSGGSAYYESYTTRNDCISEYMFANLRTIKHIILPKGVTEISSRAFWYNTIIESIVIPESVVEMKEGAFEECYALSSINIPHSIQSFANRLFFGTGFESFTIPDHITSIGQYTFCGCTQLKRITIPKNITFIGERCFLYCYAMNEIHIQPSPDKLSLGNNVFEGMYSRATLYIPKGTYSAYFLTELGNFETIIEE